jgi:hypothetical protein
MDFRPWNYPGLITPQVGDQSGGYGPNIGWCQVHAYFHNIVLNTGKNTIDKGFTPVFFNDFT